MILVRSLTYYVSIHLRRYLNLDFVCVFILSIYYFWFTCVVHRMRDYFSLKNICFTHFNLNKLSRATVIMCSRRWEEKSYVMKANKDKLWWQMKGTKPLLQKVNNLYPRHAPFEHSTMWICVLSYIRLFLDKLLKINSPWTPNMRCTIASNKLTTKCTYPY